jgi:hypothetical protein
MDIAALRLLHKLIQFGDVVVDRAGQQAHPLVQALGGSTVERLDNLGVDRQGGHYTPPIARCRRTCADRRAIRA